MSRTGAARAGLVLGSLLSVSCMAPGGAVSGLVVGEDGMPVADAGVEVDFLDGGVAHLKADHVGYFFTMWSHGSWRGAVVRASGPGRKPVSSTIGWEVWTCTFRLVPNTAEGASSAQCARKARGQ